MTGGLWIGPPKGSEVYRIVGKDGRVLEYTFFPGSPEALAIHLDGKRYCAQLCTMKGSYGRRIIHRLWYVDCPRQFKYLLVEPGFEPVCMEYDAKANDGDACDTFPAVGKRVYSVILVSRDEYRIDLVSLRPAPDADLSQRQVLRERLKASLRK